MNLKDLVSSRQLFSSVKDKMDLEGLENKDGEVDQSIMHHYLYQFK
jgi:predicted amidophosphoribosyltransferase